MSACVAPRQDVVVSDGETREIFLLSKAQTVAFPLLLAAADRCPFDQDGTYGFVLGDIARPALQAGSWSGQGIVVSQVYARSPAARAGLQTGDRLIEVNTRDVSRDTAFAASDLVRRLTKARVQPLQLDVMRAGQRLQLLMETVPSCQFTLSLVRADVVNAVSNGKQIVVTTGLMYFVRSDDELAWVLAHEIAHNVLGHVPDARLRAMLSDWLSATMGEAGGPAPSSRSLEVDADYLGAYLMARAGFELEAVRRFWQRMGKIEVYPGGSTAGIERSHPTTQERIEAFDATLNEIRDKRAQGRALDPVLHPH